MYHSKASHYFHRYKILSKKHWGFLFLVIHFLLSFIHYSCLSYFCLIFDRVRKINQLRDAEIDFADRKGNSGLLFQIKIQYFLCIEFEAIGISSEAVWNMIHIFLKYLLFQKKKSKKKIKKKSSISMENLDFD